MKLNKQGVSRQEWWKPLMIPGIMVASLGALGTIIVKSAVYIQIPDKLEAAEKKNVEQDQELASLTRIADQNQKILDRLTTPRVEEVDDDGEIKTMTVEGVRMCCSGRDCWPWSKKTKCVKDD